MTLVAGFRCRNGGVLLCADREETEGDFKRPVDKIYRIGNLPQAQIFIAGAGPASIITKACEAIHKSLIQASNSGIDLWNEHHNLIEAALKEVYDKYVIGHDYRIGLIVVFASMVRDRHPLLYKTEDAMLISQPLYTAQGTGKPIADYLSDRLYKHGAIRSALAVIAAFIFREAEDSTAGVGSGMDMQFIFDGDNSIQSVGWDEIKELKSTIPALQDALHNYWQNNPTISEKLAKILDAPMPSASHTSKDQQ